MSQILVLRFDKMDISEYFLFSSGIIPLFSDEIFEKHGITDYLVPVWAGGGKLSVNSI